MPRPTARPRCTRVYLDPLRRAGAHWPTDLLSVLEIRRILKILDLIPDRVMMVAARPHDLRGAQGSRLQDGFRRLTVGIRGQDGHTNDTPDPSLDVVASDLHDLARQLGV